MAQGIDSQAALIKALASDATLRTQAECLVALRNWLSRVTHADPASGELLATDAIEFLNRVCAQGLPPDQGRRDRLQRLAEDLLAPLQGILGQMREKIVRDHAVMPLYAAKEMDSVSVQWLSRQQGTTLRQKLGNQRRVMAVQRRSSVDTAENRLLKSVLLRLDELLQARGKVFQGAGEESCEALLVHLQRWLRGDEAAEIGLWQNVPPNNTLLQDRRYRKVWDAWQMLLSLDESIAADAARMRQDLMLALQWQTLAALYRTGRFRLLQQPLAFDYHTFAIKPVLPIQGCLFPLRDDRKRGKIKTVNQVKRFGFITDRQGDDYFFHQSNLDRALNFSALQPGLQVQFVVGQNKQGPCADNISEAAAIDVFDIRPGEQGFNLEGQHQQITVNYGDSEIVVTQSPSDRTLRFPLADQALTEVVPALARLMAAEIAAPTEPEWDVEPQEQMFVQLCAARPVIGGETGHLRPLPVRLMQQLWPGQTVNCDRASALRLGGEQQTISMRSLFLPDSPLTETQKSEAARAFIQQLKQWLPAERLCWLAPDWSNEFQLQHLARNINATFPDSVPLPESIAALLAWQSSPRFVRDAVAAGDKVLIFDVFEGGLSVTPVQAIALPEVVRQIPSTCGIGWERHPAFILEGYDCSATIQHLSAQGCPHAEALFSLFGAEGLILEAGQLSLVDQQWFHLPVSMTDTVCPEAAKVSITPSLINDCLSQLALRLKGGRVHILALNRNIKSETLPPNVNWIGGGWSLTAGARALAQWQKQAGETPLWRDHLPVLSLMDIPQPVANGKYWWADFALVDNQTVTPMRGRSMRIQVAETFTLPAGRAYYRFPLRQGQGQQLQQYVAELRSPAFPLPEDTPCTLEMTYHYGEEIPYELIFVPTRNAAGRFRPAQVKWLNDADHQQAKRALAAAPAYPAAKGWADYLQFPDQNKGTVTDLADWTQRNMATIDEWQHFFSASVDSIRKFDDNGPSPFPWRQDKNGHYFFMRHYDYGRVFFHQRHFKSFDAQATSLSFDLLPQQEPNEFVAKEIASGRAMTKDNITHLRSSLRFPTLTLWNNAFSLNSGEMPPDFCRIVTSGIASAQALLDADNVPESLKEELFNFLCYLHVDAPESVVRPLMMAVTAQGDLSAKKNNIAYAIGSAEREWQQQLLAALIAPQRQERWVSSVTLEILAIALWRSRQLIFRFNKAEIATLLLRTENCLKFDLQRLGQPGRAQDVGILTRHLELLLALLRSRESQDDEIRLLLVPGSAIARRLLALTDAIACKALEKNIALTSRIHLEIIESVISSEDVALVYALRCYLSGDSGGSSIVISAIDEGK